MLSWNNEICLGDQEMVKFEMSKNIEKIKKMWKIWRKWMIVEKIEQVGKFWNMNKES